MTSTCPAPALTYYLGSRPNWLSDSTLVDWDVPLFVSATTLARYKTRGDAFPARRSFRWALDSGAFTALTSTNPDAHPWHLDASLYGGLVTRLMEDCGQPDFVAPQDWPCEPIVRERTGLTVRDHIELTVDNYFELVEQFPFVPWIPVLQGWDPADYEYCAALYEARGVDLAAEPRVGIGSICRRGDVPEIVALVEMFAARGYKLHGFGIKASALPIIGHLLASADSYAWSENARKNNHLLDGCDHRTRDCARNCTTECREHQTDCRNCPRFAQHWRRRVLARMTGAPTREGRVVTVVAALPVVEDETGQMVLAWRGPVRPMAPRPPSRPRRDRGPRRRTTAASSGLW